MFSRYLLQSARQRGQVLAAGLMAIWMGATAAVAQDGPFSLPLWPQAPEGAVNSAAESADKTGNISNVSVPGITVYLPEKEHNTGIALIVCPGGSYRLLAWPAHVEATAQYFTKRGIAVIGLKYRTSPPGKITPNDRSLPLSDLKRAVRVVRNHAAEWNIDPERIGVLGFSAGGNLAVTLASEFDDGEMQASDPLERTSSRPDFVIGCSVWHWRQPASPFTFSKKTPPVFLVHASDDKVAPIQLAEAIKQQLEETGVPVHLETYATGGHGVAHLSSRSTSATWADHFLDWLNANGLGSRQK